LTAISRRLMLISRTARDHSMRTTKRAITWCCIAASLFVFSTAAFALDPVTLIVLRMLRDQVLSSTLEAGITSARLNAAPAAAPALPNGSITDAQLRGLVDEGFVYLSAGQRDEVYSSMQRLLADPRYAQARPFIIEEFARKAAAARVAHERLSHLSPTEQKEVALRTVAEYRQLPPDEGAQLLSLLRAGTAPIPRELNELILAAVADSPNDTEVH